MRANFTKKWRGGTHWAQDVRHSQMRSVRALMERRSAEIETGLEKIAALKDLIPERQILKRVHPDAPPALN
jgi:hypothetical protein